MLLSFFKREEVVGCEVVRRGFLWFVLGFIFMLILVVFLFVI